MGLAPNYSAPMPGIHQGARLNRHQLRRFRSSQQDIIEEVMMKTEIVADGARRRIDTKAVLERRRELKKQLEKQYTSELKTTN
ncbi:MAG: hypothetical protein AAGB46_08570 [Verrucomicrobiota bacterium]